MRASNRAVRHFDTVGLEGSGVRFCAMAGMALTLHLMRGVAFAAHVCGFWRSSKNIPLRYGEAIDGWQEQSLLKRSARALREWIPLEQDFQPGWYDRVSTSIFPVAFAVSGLAYALPHVAAVRYAFLCAAVVPLLSSGISLCVPWQWYPLKKAMDLLSGSIIHTRNEVMAAEISRTLQPQHEGIMLAVMGMAHLPGVAHQLTTRHGFRAVGLHYR